MSEINSFQIFLFLLSALITITTAIVVRDVRKEDLKQESRDESPTKREIDLENSRPVFELQFDHKGLHPFFKRENEKTVRRFSGNLLNKGGTVNSINIHYNYQEKRPENLEEILSDREFFKGKKFEQELGGLSRGGSLPMTTPRFDWPAEKKLWFVLWIDYEYLNGIKEECVFDFNINGATVSEQTIRMYPHSRLNTQ